jgi:hypothetical protein
LASRSGVGRRQRERAQDRLLEQWPQPLALLLVASREQHRAGAERVDDARDGDYRASLRQLFADEHSVERWQADPAVLLGHVRVHQPEVIKLARVEKLASARR